MKNMNLANFFYWISILHFPTTYLTFFQFKAFYRKYLQENSKEFNFLFWKKYWIWISIQIWYREKLSCFPLDFFLHENLFAMGNWIKKCDILWKKKNYQIMKIWNFLNRWNLGFIKFSHPNLIISIAELLISIPEPQFKKCRLPQRMGVGFNKMSSESSKLAASLRIFGRRESY